MRKDGKNYIIKFQHHNIYLWSAIGRMVLGSTKRPNENSDEGIFTFDDAKAMISRMKQPEKFSIEFIEVGHPPIIDFEKYAELEKKFS